MKKFRVDTESWGSQEFVDYNKALAQYEMTKDNEMGEGVHEDSYVELVVSTDDFEDYVVLKRAAITVDEDKMKVSTPRQEGYDWDYWAKWVEYTNEELI